jgi:hypothetical protein
MSAGQTEGELRQDIERTRQHLGETAEALAAKADVKARAMQKVNEVKEQATARASQVRGQAAARAGQAKDKAASGWWNDPSVLAGAAAVVFAGIAVALWRRR